MKCLVLLLFTALTAEATRSVPSQQYYQPRYYRYHHYQPYHYYHPYHHPKHYYHSYYPHHRPHLPNHGRETLKGIAVAKHPGGGTSYVSNQVFGLRGKRSADYGPGVMDQVQRASYGPEVLDKVFGLLGKRAVEYGSEIWDQVYGLQEKGPADHGPGMLDLRRKSSDNGPEALGHLESFADVPEVLYQYDSPTEQDDFRDNDDMTVFEVRNGEISEKNGDITNMKPSNKDYSSPDTTDLPNRT
ncbi:uncharacterized protein LOC135205998 [Macrobrachium nipponense]|uniref:uncharacterized protein LOC135205998 n=1 Tax=Macrobrachium nipponense TaxID=159736 RepID=UPI0030C88CA2